MLASIVCLMSLATSPEIVIEHLVGKEYPGTYKHPATMTQLDNGDLYASYYGGSGEYEEDSRVYGMRQKKGQRKWSAPEVIADTPFLGEGNSVVWQAPDGLVWLFYVQRYGDTWSDSRVNAKISRDGAKTWSDGFVIGFEQGTMCRGLPIVLNDGDYLLPLYHETGHDQEKTSADTCSFFLRHNPKTRSWTPTNCIVSEKGNLQAEPVQIDDNHLLAYIRRGGGFLPDEIGYIIKAESTDGGRSWGPGTNTAFPNPNAAVSLLKLKNGHLLLIFNESMNERTPLTAAISTDNGATWPYKKNLATGPFDYAYPCAIQTKDGKIHVIFTQDERQTVKQAIFSEQAITD